MRIMTRLAIASAATLAMAGSAMAQQIVLQTNKSAPLKLRGEASSVVIGNPRIADVAVHDSNLIFVTGRTFGTTNLLVFNEAGEQVYSGDVVVTENNSNLVSVNRAGSTNTYDCAPRCRSVLAIGDDAAYFDIIATQNEDLQILANADN